MTPSPEAAGREGKRLPRPAINASEGTTVVLVSHELELVRRHAHHVIALNKGVVAFEGPPDQLPATGGLDSLFVRG